MASQPPSSLKTYVAAVGVVVVLAAGVLILARSGDQEEVSNVTAHGSGVFVSAPSDALDDGARLRIQPVAGHAEQPWPNVKRIGPVVAISPTSGRLHGQAKISFRVPANYHARLRDLMVTVYNPALHARLAVPAAIDSHKRSLTVMTQHLSKWELDQSDPDLHDATKALVRDIGEDTVKHNGHPAQGFFERLSPPVQSVACDRPPSRGLAYTVTDYGLPYATQVCAEGTGDPDTAVMKLLNIHSYPVVVKVPRGVTIEPQVIKTDDLAEVLSQLSASLTGGDSFLLRGFHTVTLRVRVKDLPDDAKITEDVDPASLMKDMGFWLAGFAVDQGGAKWDGLKKVLKTKADLEQLTGCFADAVNAVQDRERRFSGKNGKKNAAKFIHDTLNKCIVPAGKAIHGFWAKARHETAKVGKRAVSPIVAQLNQLKRLWDDPGVLTEWTEGLLAGLVPEHAGRVTIALSRRDPTVYFDAHPTAVDPSAYVERPSRLAGRTVTFRELQWRDWGSDVATATGVADVNQCLPYCVDDNRETGDVTIEVSRVEDVDDHWVYRCLKAEVRLADGETEYQGWTTPCPDLPPDRRPGPANAPGGRACGSISTGERRITAIRAFGTECAQARKIARVGWTVAPPGWGCTDASPEGDYRCARGRMVVKFRAIGSD